MNILVALAFLVGGTGLPTLVHAHGGTMVHALELLDRHDQSPEPADEDRTVPDQSAHHHCGSTLDVHVSALPLIVLPSAAPLLAGLATPLTSLNRAPPTEPPTA